LHAIRNEQPHAMHATTSCHACASLPAELTSSPGANVLVDATLAYLYLLPVVQTESGIAGLSLAGFNTLIQGSNVSTPGAVRRGRIDGAPCHRGRSGVV
jgi:hypothetical protein